MLDTEAKVHIPPKSSKYLLWSRSLAQDADICGTWHLNNPLIWVPQSVCRLTCKRRFSKQTHRHSPVLDLMQFIAEDRIYLYLCPQPQDLDVFLGAVRLLTSTPFFVPSTSQMSILGFRKILCEIWSHLRAPDRTALAKTPLCENLTGAELLVAAAVCHWISYHI